MVAWKDGKVETFPIEEVVADGTMLLNTNSDFVKAAAAVGMYVGEIEK